MLYTFFISALSIGLWNPSTWSLTLTEHPTFPFIWGGFSPIGYHVLEFVAIYFMFHKKFGWKSPFMFMLVWGFEDVFYNSAYMLTHLSGAVAYLNMYGFLEVISIETLIAIIGLWFLHPKLDLSLTFIKIFSVVIFVGINIYLALYGYPSLDDTIPSNEILILNFASFVSNAGYLLVMYTILAPRPQEETPDVL